MSNQIFLDTISDVCEKEIERRLHEYLDRLSSHFKIEKVDLLTVCKNDGLVTNYTENYKKMTVKELRKKCNDMGIRTLNYPKQVLIEKLVAHESNPPQTNIIEHHVAKKQINTFTKKELISYCKEHGIPYKHNDVKQKILACVEEHYSQQNHNEASSEQENEAFSDSKNTSLKKKRKYKRTCDIVPIEFSLEENDTNDEIESLLNVDVENGEISSKSTDFVLSTTDISTLPTVDPNDYRNMLQNLSNHSITNKMNTYIEKNKSRVFSCVDVYSMNKSELVDLCVTKGMKTNGIREKDLRIGLGKKLREERDIFQNSNEKIL